MHLLQNTALENLSTVRDCVTVNTMVVKTLTSMQTIVDTKAEMLGDQQKFNQQLSL